MSSVAWPPTAPRLDHLDAMTDARGLFEHALLSTPRPEHGYCVDDVARGLVVLGREPDLDVTGRRLEQCYLDFVLAALAPDGRCHNRMDVAGDWRDEPGLGDWWGRAIWGLGVASGGASTAGRRARAVNGLRIALRRRSPHPRAMAFAALGAAAFLQARPAEPGPLALLVDAVTTIGADGPDPRWPWPEPELGYGNGSVAEALLVAGEALERQDLIDRGLRLLGFLLRIETADGHLSLTPVGGRSRDDVGVGFDQQPIEAAALADACATAFRLTSDPRWSHGVELAWRWFAGDNDSAVTMFDADTGAGYDGLEADGRNLNQGAESTLAMLSTAQHAERLQVQR